MQKTLSEQLVLAAISYYQAALKVNRLKEPIYVSKGNLKECAKLEPQKSMEKGVEADLVLIVFGYHSFMFGQDYSSNLAISLPCAQDSKTNRY